MTDFNIENINKIHFIGIGGIGMSALARMFLDMGKIVSGSDSNKTELTEKLKDEGVKISYVQQAENIDKDTDVVVYTLAVPENNSELLKAKELNIQTFYYAEMLGLVSNNLYTIAVSGTHGKTTTTAMLASALESADKKPNVIVGSILNEKGSNYVKGESNYFIVEACEYKRSFLNINPKVLIITNLEEDHLDYYKDLTDIQSAFRELALKIPSGGYLICDVDDENIKPVIDNLKCKVIDYKKYIQLVPELNIPGEHNIKNAGCVLAVCDALNIDIKDSQAGSQKFKGTWRRSQFIRKTKNENLIFDDYAHHPSEISTTLLGFKNKYKDKKIVLIFEPHLYSRTKEHFNEFIVSLSIADKIILAPIYAAREKKDESINSDMLAQKIKNSEYVEDLDKIKALISEIDSQEKDILFITMGAGGIYQIWNDALAEN